MKEENIQKFVTWWKSRRHEKTKTKGLLLSTQTLISYKSILSRTPDIIIDENTDVDDTIIFIRNFLKNEVRDTKNKDRKFKKEYPQLIFAIRTYLRMYESDEYIPKINRIAREIRKELKPQITSSAKETQKLFIDKCLSKEQIREIINCIPNNLNFGIGKEKAIIFFQLLYDTGCRINELAKITIQDIDFDTREIRIVGKGQYIRKVKYEESTSNLLNEFLNKYCQGKNKLDVLFDWKVDTCKKYFKEIINSIYIQHKQKLNKNFKNISPHWFRHSRATHLAIIWKDIFMLKDFMGWRDIKMAEIYITNLTLLSSSIQKYKSTDLWEN